MLRWLASLAAVLSLALLVGIWRLMLGPVELNWLAPYVEAALDRSDIGLKVAFSGVRLGIDRDSHQLDLRALDVRLSLPDGEPLARFPEMATSFGLGYLLRGRLEPTQVVVEHPVFHLKRDAGGAISARIGASAQGAPNLDPQLIAQLAGPPQRHTPLGLLRHISIRGATVIVDDRRSGRTWQADHVDIAVERGAKGARGDLSLAVPVGAGKPELHASYRYLAERQLLDLDLSVDGVEPAALPPLIPELAQLRHIAAPVSGTLHTRIDLQQAAAQGSRLDLAVGSGRVYSDWLPTGSIAVEQGELHATYAPERAEVRIGNASLDLGGGAGLRLEGTLAGVTPELIAATQQARPAGLVRGNIAATLTHVPAARLGELWPAALSPGGRRWTLANIQDGVLDEAAVQLALDLDPVGHTANVLNHAGHLRYHNLTVTYFKGLPPVRKVDGTANFAQNHVEFVPTGGVLKGIKVNGGSLKLTNLGDPVEWLTIDLGLAGPLQDVLDVLDSRPLHYAHAIGLDPAHVGGRTETQLHFKLPLLDALKLDQVDYAAKATISGASIAKVALDRGIRDGNLVLDLARSGVHLQGTAQFDEIPASLDAAIPLHAASGPQQTYRVQMTLDNKAQHRLGLDIPAERLNGPIALDATYHAFAGGRGEATAQLDLSGAALALAEAGWKKPAGQPGAAKIVLDLANEQITRIRQIDVTAPGLDGRLSALLGSDHRHVERFDIRHLAVGDSDISGTVSQRPGGGWRAAIHAARIDARHLLQDAMSDAPAEPSPPLALTARIDRLVLGPQRELHAVNAELLRSGGQWQSGHIDGRYGNGHRLSLHFGEGGGQRLVLASDDLGAGLKLLDIADNVVGGRLTVDGELSEASGKRQLRAHIEGRDYTVTRASLMARLLALPSLTGIVSTLSGSGLPFSTLRGDIVYGGGHITLERLLAFGEALGVTASGWVDTEHDRLQLQGTVAPAYALNSLLGHLPIIGLLGGGSQGLLAANYRLSGASASPEVAVNPLSALAPGFLRQLFAPLVGFPASSESDSK